MTALVEEDFEKLSLAPQTSNSSSDNSSSQKQPKTVMFDYDPDLLKLCQTYISENNHHGLALIARQKGIPPFLRFKAWPILLKYHPFVHNPFLQPDMDSEERKKEEKTSDNAFKKYSEISETEANEKLKATIAKDVKKYIQRLNFKKEKDLSETETEIFDIIEYAIYRFVTKWGRIINYDKAISWLALGLAEWVPPIPNTPWVLVGRNISNTENFYKPVYSDYQDFVDSHLGLQQFLDEMVEEETISNMKFHHIFERLALVLLHSPENNELRGNFNGNHPSNTKIGNTRSNSINKTTLPIHGGTIEERVSFFIYLIRKLMPELCTHFQDEQILNKFGSNDDEWLIWWLKWCGSKVWSREDRGRLWDLMLGYKKIDSNYSKKLGKLKLDSFTLNLLGPENFWSAIDIEDNINEDNEEEGEESNNKNTNDSNSSATSTSSFTSDVIRKGNSFKDLIQGLSSNKDEESQTKKTPEISSTRSSSFSSVSSVSLSDIPVSRLDPHIELIFISIAMLKSREHTLVELDQHEIRQYLLKLPSKTYSMNDKYKQHLINKMKEKEKGKKEDHQTSESKENESQESRPSTSPSIVESPCQYVQKKNYMDDVISEAGELWRKWLWSEMREDE